MSARLPLSTGSMVARIPALAVHDSTVVFACDGREDFTDLPGHTSILYAVGTVGEDLVLGQTQVLRPAGERGYADPCLVWHEDTCHAFYVGSIGASFWDDAHKSWSVWHSILGPSGWEHIDITHDVWPQWAGSIFVSSGSALSHEGRLYLPMVGRKTGTQERASFVVSTRNGHDWSMSDPLWGGDECKLAMIDDRLILSTRATPHRLVAFSDDGGATFTPWQADVPDPGCQAGLCAWKDGLALTSIDPNYASSFSSPGDPTGGHGTNSGPQWDQRAGLVLRTGRPGSWDVRVLDDGPAAYSVCAPVGDRLLVCWESGPYTEIRYELLS